MSTEAQLKGDSLRRQVELSKDYAEQNDLELVDDFQLHDIGVSAFKGDNAATGALKRFLAAIESGAVPPGSYLLVESLDRLSRDRITAAMQLFLGITEKGVNIVTLSDRQVYRAGQADFPQLVYSMAMMCRANDESQIKSQRVGAAWKNKRDNAGSQKLTAMAPKWLFLAEDRSAFQVIEDRADVVRRIYRLAGEGNGTYSITQLLNREGVTPFGKSNGWNESYVEKILKNRAVLGEYQPHTTVDGNRRPVGEPVLEYYPRIITDEQFLAVQADRRKRATYGGGRKGPQLKNLFTHVATCGYCGAPMRMVDKGSGPKGGRYLKCSAGVRGIGCTTKAWRYEDFERSFLFLAREVDLVSVMKAEATHKAAVELDQRLAAAEERIARVTLQRERFAQLAGDPAMDLNFLRGKLATAQIELQQATDLMTTLKEEKATKATPTIDPEGLQQMIAELKQLTGTEAYELRSRLASRLQSVVRSLVVFTEGRRPRTPRLLAAKGAGFKYSDAGLPEVDKLYPGYEGCNPSFKMTFVDGTTREATVATDGPLTYVSESVVVPDGVVTFMKAGQLFYLDSRTNSPK